jgi:hypothetical protein
MDDYTTAEKYKMLKLNGYLFTVYDGAVTWGQDDCRGYVFGGKCEGMEEAVGQAFEEWERGL